MYHSESHDPSAGRGLSCLLTGCGLPPAGELIFEHDLELCQADLVNAKKLGLCRCRQDNIRVNHQSNACLAAALACQLDQGDENVLRIQYSVMVVSDHLSINFRQIPFFKKPQALFNMHGGDHFLQHRQQVLVAYIVEHPSQVGLINKALVATTFASDRAPSAQP